MTISANEIKQRGVSFFDTLLDKFDELIINVRGKDKYVVLDIQDNGPGIDKKYNVS